LVEYPDGRQREIENNLVIGKFDGGLVLSGHTGSVNAVCFLSNTENLFASASSDKTVRIWNWKTGKCVHVLNGHTDSVNTLCIINANQFASGSDDSTIRLWNIKEGACLCTLSGHTGPVLDLELVRSGLIVSGSEDGSIRVWSAPKQECIRTMHVKPNDNPSAVTSLSFVDGNMVVAGYKNGNVRMWDICYDKAKPLPSAPVGQTSISSVALSNKYLLAASKDKCIRCWEPGQLIKTVRGVDANVLTWMEGEIIAISGSDNNCSFFDLESETWLKSMEGHSSQVNDICYLGLWIFCSCSNDNTIWVWDAFYDELNRKEPLKKALKNLNILRRAELPEAVIDLICEYELQLIVNKLDEHVLNARKARDDEKLSKEDKELEPVE